MNLNIASWKEFYIRDCDQHSGLFKIETCKCGCAGDLEEGDEINYIGAKKSENGVMKKVLRDEKLVSKGNGIIFICDGEGSVGYTNYIQEDFIGSTTLSVGYNENLNSVNALFIVAVLDKEKYKFSYGRKYRAHINDIKIKLPATTAGEPDWVFMEQYIKSLNCKPLSTANRGGESPTLGVDSWEEFCLGDIFDIKKGKRLTSDDQTDGETPYIGAIDSNNGVANYIGQEAIHEGNTISLSYNGSVGEAFYQPKPFWATDDVNVLYFRPENNAFFNKYIGLFFCAVLRQEKYRYSYGRKWVLESMRTTTVRLPSKDGKPDFEFMESYMRSLPYGDRI